MFKLGFLTRKSKQQPATTGGEIMEAETAVAVSEEAKAKTSADFFSEFPDSFSSKLQYEDPNTQRTVKEMVDKLKKLPQVINIQEKEKSKPHSGAEEFEKPAYDQPAKALERILDTAITPTVERSGTVPQHKINQTHGWAQDTLSQFVTLRIYRTKYSDIHIVETDNKVYSVVRGRGETFENAPYFETRRRFVAIISEEDVFGTLRKGNPGDFELQSELRRIDPDFASQFEKVKETSF